MHVLLQRRDLVARCRWLTRSEESLAQGACRTHPSTLLHNEAARRGGYASKLHNARSEAPDTKHRGCACVQTHNEQGRARAGLCPRCVSDSPPSALLHNEG
eukprot:1249254-Prymnesium_polylepis.2